MCTIQAALGETVNMHMLNIPTGANWLTFKDMTDPSGLTEHNTNIGNCVTAVCSHGDNITLDNIDVTGPYAFVELKGNNVTWKNSELGTAGTTSSTPRLCNNDPEPVQISEGSNMLIDHVIFHPFFGEEVQANCGGNDVYHLETIRAWDSINGFTLSNSWFDDGRGDDSATFSSSKVGNPPNNTNMRIVGNYFGNHCCGYAAPDLIFGDQQPCAGWVVVYNLFKNGDAGLTDYCSSESGMVYVGNMAYNGGGCPFNGVNTGNLFTSTAAQGHGTCAGNTWVTAPAVDNYSAFNLAPDGMHLTASSPAINAGESSYCSTWTSNLDYDGQARSGVCDAGPDEFIQAVANLWVDTNGGTCTRSATPVAYNDSVACGSFDAAWDAASAGDTIRVKAATYPAQIVDGNKTSETKIIGEDGTRVAGVAACAQAFGSDGAFCANADFMTLENVTIDALNNQNVSSGSQINASNVTYHNVNIFGDYVSISIDGPNFTWQHGSHGQDGIDGKPRTCEFSAGEPVWIFAANATLDDIRFNPKKIQPGGVNNYCGADVTPHLETIRTESGAINTTIKNSWFVAGSDAGSGHIFTSTGAPGLKLINNVFEPVNGSYSIQAASSACDWTVAYNTFEQGVVLGCQSSSTWVGNLGVSFPGCEGTHTKNVWQDTGTCGTDTFIGSQSLGIGSGGHLIDGSPAIDAAETAGATDYCTHSLGALDFEGEIRPSGAACDAGADEFGSSGGGGNDDTTAPTVSVTAPSNGATVSGNTTVSTNASDNVAVAGVQFKLDGSNLGSEDTSSPYSISWNASLASNGSHSLTAVARDAAGNTTTSSAITVTVTGGTNIILGNQAVESLADSLAFGQSEAWPFTASGSGNISTISLYLDSSSTAQGVLVGLYTDSFGAPGSLLASATISSPISGWNTANFALSPAITSGTNYWLAALGTGSGSVVVRDRGTGGTCNARVNAVPNNWVSLHNPFGALDPTLFNQCPLSAYVTAAASGGGGTTKPGDVNGDGSVNLQDLSILLSHYGQSATASQGDLTGDNLVTLVDLSILLSHYGS
jgi:hypothetical protein